MFAPILLLLAVVVYRVGLALGGHPHVVGWNNFSPMAAVVLCGALFLPRRWALLLPLAALLISDLLLNAHYHASLVSWVMLAQYAAFGFTAAVGWSLRGQPRLWQVFAACLGGSVLFYVVTNSGAWLYEPAYAKTWGGWMQALTVGVPGQPPTLLFLRNTVLSDLAFTALFLVSLRVPATAPLAAPRPVSA
jgi:uncharacterized protein DUF6580